MSVGNPFETGPRVELEDPETVQEILEDTPEAAKANMECAEGVLGALEEGDVPDKSTVRRTGDSPLLVFSPTIQRLSRSGRRRRATRLSDRLSMGTASSSSRLPRSAKTRRFSRLSRLSKRRSPASQTSKTSPTAYRRTLFLLLSPMPCCGGPSGSSSPRCLRGSLIGSHYGVRLPAGQLRPVGPSPSSSSRLTCSHPPSSSRVPVHWD
jgi:hypothetical protein